MKSTLRPLMLTVALATGALPALAADTPSPPPPSAAPARLADPLAPARMHILGQRWPAAIDELRKVNATGNADWNNLMGYALRKQASPDLDGAQRFYDAALRLEPQHRGALEYSGELALMKGDLASAEKRLAALSQACGSAGCEELADLQKAVARFKSNGNRYVP
jgi:Flp pilus assembly protein TadD